jgi:predicted porin
MTNRTLRIADRKLVMSAAIAALLAGASGLAAAQSSVTIYGRVGGGVD